MSINLKKTIHEQEYSIVHSFLHMCERTPDRDCIRFEGHGYSYRQVYQAAVGWMEHLQVAGLQPGERVGLYLDNSPSFLMAYLGVYLARGIVVLINTQYRQVELRHILCDAGVRLCITDAERQPELARVQPELPALASVITVQAALTSQLPAVERPFSALTLPNPDDIALLAYTSGTTGRSKGAMLTHSNLYANSRAVTTAWHWTADDVLLLTLPLFHIHGLGVGMHGTWLTGGTVDLRRRFDAAEVYDTLLTGRVTMFFGVPTMYTRLIAEARQRKQRPASLRLYVSGSAPLSGQTFTEFEQLFGQRILERYGMTETVMNLTNPYDGERRPGSVGQPFAGQEARIVDVQSRQPVPDDVPGEIQVRGAHVFRGYWQQPEATAEAFTADGWFNTGDIGWRSGDGYYTITGRVKELIISGGYNIYPREVEEVLAHHPAVAEAAVIGLPHPDLGEQVVAVVVTAGDMTMDERQHLPGRLVEYCRDHLAAYKKPRQVLLVDMLPRNAMGKVQKPVLREQLLQGESAST